MAKISKETKNLILFLSGRFESLLGASALAVAFPLYVLDLTGSGTIMGIFTLVGNLPRFFILPFAGVIGDRFNRKHLMVWLDAIRGFIYLFGALLAFMKILNVPVLLLLVGIIGLLDGLFDAPTSAMVADIVDKNNMRKAMSFNSSVSSIAYLIGPILGGVIYGFAGMKNVLVFTGLFFLFSAFTEIFIEYTWVKKESKVNVFGEIRQALGFVLSHGGLKFLFAFAAVLNLLASPLFSIVVPYIYRQKLQVSPQTFGVLQSSFTFGALIGSVIAGTILVKVSSKKMVSLGIVAQSTIFLTLSIVISPFVGLSRNLIVLFSYIFFVLGGMANIIVNIPIGTNLQLLIPSELRSRVLSLLSILSGGLVPLGAVLNGVIIDKVNPFIYFVVVNILIGVVSLLFVKFAPEETFMEKSKEVVQSVQ